MTQDFETDFFLIRKIPYSDRAEILKGLSPEKGLLTLIVRGTLTGPKRTYPELEPFRFLHLKLQGMNKELPKVMTADLLEDYTAISKNLSAFRAGCWLASFAQMNVMAELPHPFFFNAVTVAFHRLLQHSAAVQKDTTEPILCTDGILAGALLAFLFEEGWLAPYLDQAGTREQLRTILEMASGKQPPPATEAEWKAQFQWCLELLLFNECRLPESADTK